MECLPRLHLPFSGWIEPAADEFTLYFWPEDNKKLEQAIPATSKSDQYYERCEIYRQRGVPFGLLYPQKVAIRSHPSETYKPRMPISLVPDFCNRTPPLEKSNPIIGEYKRVIACACEYWLGRDVTINFLERKTDVHHSGVNCWRKQETVTWY